MGLDQETLFIVKEYIREHQEYINEQLEAQRYYENKALPKGMNHDFLSLLVDEKIDYLLGKEPTLECKNKAYLDATKEILGQEYLYDLQELAREASIKRIAWWQSYVDENGLHFEIIPSEEVIPVWHDKRHRELDMLIRRYPIEEYKGTHKETIWKVEIYTKEYAYFYEERSGNLILDVQKYIDLNIPDDQEASHFYINGQGYNMGRVPFAWCKNNPTEKSDLDKVKDLIDAYNNNRMRLDDMLEDFKNWIVAIKNYEHDEENINVFEEMMRRRYIFTDGDGGADILTPNIDTTANDSHNQQIKDDIILFGQSVDKNKMLSGNAASGVALKFLYAGLDLKCNAIEREINKCFNMVEWFIREYLKLLKVKVSDTDYITIIFNRDVSINEEAAINMCKASVGVISDKTIVANHPWVQDADEEMKQLEEENKSDLEYIRKSMVGGSNGEQE
nr:MAG TPA: PORTAL PROTEIN [Caudoviricetes sp.]